MIRRPLLVLLLSLPAWHAQAQAPDLPALFDVTGVAANDVLNVRSAPDAGSTAVGFLAPDAKGIEVTERAPNGDWGKINLTETSGWVALRFLAPREEGAVEATLPADLRCAGSEPFWSLRLGEGQTVMAIAGEVTHELPEAERLASRNIPDRFGAVAADGGADLAATIARLPCNDGMSELDFGLEAQIILRDDSGTRQLSGCCSVDAE